jgi:hypothetical protein
VLLLAVPLKLMLTTRAPWSAAQVSPEATADHEQLPEVSHTRTGMTEQDQQTPATPTPLLVSAPMMPATSVPWLGELGSEASASLLTKS